jgi:hypothetical protein
MVCLLKKERVFMQQAMPNSAINANAEQEKPIIKPWLQQEGESTLWYNRFKRYRALGPKRSLLAAVEQERGQITALKSTNEVQKSTGKRARKTKAAPSHLAPVAAVKPVQVPGSWKQASIKWSWVERALAFDADLINRQTEKALQEAISSKNTFPADRVRVLNTLLDTVLEAFNNTSKTAEQVCSYVARMQSILRDIREEMKLYNEDVARLAISTRIEKEYQEISDKKIKGIL